MNFSNYFFSKKYFEIIFIILLSSIVINLLLLTISIINQTHPYFPVLIILTVYGFKGLSQKYKIPSYYSFFLPFALYLMMLISGDYSLDTMWQMPILLIGLILYYNYTNISSTFTKLKENINNKKLKKKIIYESQNEENCENNDP